MFGSCFGNWTSLVAQTVKHLPTMRETRVPSLGQEDLLEKEMATHSSILACKIPWMEEPGRLQSMGSERVRHDWFHLLHFWELNVKGYGCRHPDAPPLIEQWRGKVSHVFHGLARWCYVGIIWNDCPRSLSAKLHLSKKKLEYTTGCRNWGGFLTGQPRRKLVGCWKAAVGALWGSYVSTKN